MCSRCDEIKEVAERHEFLTKSLEEHPPGNFVHGLEVEECPNCGAVVYSNLEGFLIDGCRNCDYKPRIEFVDIDNASGDD